ncbi:MAG: hypothetical protein ACPGUV_12825 [Polyangiales bacterium]
MGRERLPVANPDAVTGMPQRQHRLCSDLYAHHPLPERVAHNVLSLRHMNCHNVRRGLAWAGACMVFCNCAAEIETNPSVTDDKIWPFGDSNCQVPPGQVKCYRAEVVLQEAIGNSWIDSVSYHSTTSKNARQAKKTALSECESYIPSESPQDVSFRCEVVTVGHEIVAADRCPEGTKVMDLVSS